MKSKLALISIDFTCFLKLNTILKLKIKKNKEIESKRYVKTISKNL